MCAVIIHGGDVNDDTPPSIRDFICCTLWYFLVNEFVASEVSGTFWEKLTRGIDDDRPEHCFFT